MRSAVVARPFVGVDILPLITSGIYADPLVVYREYIQNAADSICGSEMTGNGRIEIAIAASERRVTIRDNGPGLSVAEARRALIPIGASEKERGEGRGFRGIGRLAGLAFSESVTFVTRAGPEAPVVSVAWNGGRVRDGAKAGRTLEAVVADSVRVDTVDDAGLPDHFFEVRVEGISRYASALLMNRAAVRKYIGEVCPVPFASQFPYACEVSRVLRRDPETVGVYLDGEETAIERPHRSSLDDADEEFMEFEDIRISGLRDREMAAVGWIAHTSYAGVIPKNHGIRGVRARMGNMQVGSEDIFDHLFSEDRFNRWCVAEIHILDPDIVPNARRDYFEPGPQLRNLENQLGAMCRGIERRCRAASRERRSRRRYRDVVERAEEALDLAATGYLNVDGVKELLADQALEISKCKEECAGWSGDEEPMDRLSELQRRVEGFRAGVDQALFEGIDASDVAVYQEVFGVLAAVSPSPAVAKSTIEAILRRVGTG